MKRIMIKFTKFFTAAAVVSLVFASCLDDNDDDRLYGEECYGMVEGTGKSFSVKTDGGNTLNVTENLDAKFQAEDGMRVRMTSPCWNRSRTASTTCGPMRSARC